MNNNYPSGERNISPYDAQNGNGDNPINFCDDTLWKKFGKMSQEAKDNFLKCQYDRIKSVCEFEKKQNKKKLLEDYSRLPFVKNVTIVDSEHGGQEVILEVNKQFQS